MTTIKTPLVSIVIPTYEMKGHGISFLERCLRSIEQQMGINSDDIEIVISDQSCDQAIEQYCTQLSASFPYALHYHRTLTGRGIAAHNLNTGINLAKGQYIKILFQDDLLVEQNHLKVLVEILRIKMPDAILTAATHTKDGNSFYNPITPQPNPYFLFGNNTVSSPSVLTISQKVAKAIPFDEHLKLLFDCDFYFQLFERHYSIEICDAVSVANGVWDGQTQFAISPEQFTQEVRYLNWKYPNAYLPNLLPSYQTYFSQLHPTAPFPFEKNITPHIFQKFWWQISRQEKQ